MTLEQNPSHNNKFAIVLSLTVMVSLSAVLFAAFRPPSVNLHHHETIGAQPTSYPKPIDRHAHSVPWPRVLTDVVISIGSRLTA